MVVLLLEMVSRVTFEAFSTMRSMRHVFAPRVLHNLFVTEKLALLLSMTKLASDDQDCHKLL
jgi:hypothetical protein